MNPNYPPQQPNPYGNPQQGFPPQNQGMPNYPMQQDLPSAGLIQVFGILSVILVLGLIGYIFGWIALSMGNSAIRTYNANPNAYTPSSFSKVKSGRTCALVGVIIYSAILAIILIVIAILVIGGNM